MNTKQIESIYNDIKNKFGKYTTNGITIIHEPYDLMRRLCEALLEKEKTECNTKEDTKTNRMCSVEFICTVCVDIATDLTMVDKKAPMEFFDCYDVGGKLLLTPSIWHSFSFSDEDMAVYSISPFRLAQKINSNALDRIKCGYYNRQRYLNNKEDILQTEELLFMIQKLQEKFNERIKQWDDLKKK